MCGGHEDPGGEDGGGAHEVRLARALPQEERGEPREAAVLWLGGNSIITVTGYSIITWAAPALSSSVQMMRPRLARCCGLRTGSTTELSQG